MKVSIVLPVYNEEVIIRKTIFTIMKKAPTYFSSFEVIAVNDGSIDKTEEVLASLKKTFTNLRLFSHSRNIGYGAAFRTGVKHARFPWLFFTDADLQFDLGDIVKLLNVSKKYDFIVGWRMNRADSVKRKLASFIYNFIVRVLFALPLRDVDCAFKLMRKERIAAIRLSSNSFFISAELLVKALKKHYRIKEIGVPHYPRSGGQSKVTVQKVLQTLRDLIILYRKTHS